MIMNYENLTGQYAWSLDIETAPNENAGRFHELFATDIKAPSNYKDEDKIKAYIQEKMLEESSKDALSWVTGKIVSIAMVNVADCGREKKEHKVIAFAGANEKAILEAWCKEMESPNNGIYQVVGKYSGMFDYPFIKGRLIANSLKAPQGFKNSYNLLDIDTMLCARSGSSQVVSLNKYAFACGLDAKTMKGSDVPRLYAEAIAAKALGNNDKYAEIFTAIKDYNIKDAEITAQIAYRLML
jgi:hypothetical protein